MPMPFSIICMVQFKMAVMFMGSTMCPIVAKYYAMVYNIVDSAL